MLSIDRNYEFIKRELDSKSVLSASVFEISDPAAGLYDYKKSEWEKNLDGLEVVPPYPVVWAEYAGRPDKEDEIKDGLSFSVENTDMTHIRDYRIGVMMMSRELNPLESARATYENSEKTRENRARIRWEVKSHIFVEMGRVFKLCSTKTYLGERGEIIPERREVIIDGKRENIETRPEEEKEALEAMSMMAWPVFYTWGLLNCKNIREKTNAVNEKVRRKRQKANKPPGLDYKTLEVKLQGQWRPFPAMLGGGHSGVHLCRRHFKTYTDKAPLFGRLTGRFFVPNHTRGKNRERQIEKDYSVSH